jgi:predicted TIM-barrel fold metal-dependent hydrolase
VVDAWNDWHLEEWAGSYPGRIIANQIPWLHHPQEAAQRVYRNAERGFRALSFPDRPDNLGFPSIHTSHWDPLMGACAETGTVICLHVGSAGAIPPMAAGAPLEVGNAQFGLYAVSSAMDWLFSYIPVRFPDIKICLSEGGIGWVAAVLDRLEHIYRYREAYTGWQGIDLTPAEVFVRNFWFCALDNPSSYCQVERIGVGNILYEVDYPHADSIWPDTQEFLGRELAGLDAEIVRRISWQNASELFQHPVPEPVQHDPDMF